MVSESNRDTKTNKFIKGVYNKEVHIWFIYVYVQKNSSDV